MTDLDQKKIDILDLIKFRVDHAPNKNIEEEEHTLKIYEEKALEDLSDRNLCLILNDFRSAGILNKVELVDWNCNYLSIEDYLGGQETTLEKVIIMVFKNFWEKIGEIEKQSKNTKAGELNKSKKKEITPLALPEDEERRWKNWDDIEIKFTDQGMQDIEILSKGRFYAKADNVRFGCDKTNDKIPDKQWEFLKILAIIHGTSQNKKMQTTTTKGYLSEKLKIKENSCEQYKSELSRRLRILFGINDEPFHDYRERQCYQVKFKLKPSPELRAAELFIRKGDEPIKDFLDDGGDENE